MTGSAARRSLSPYAGCYLLPLGILGGAAARAAVDSGRALPLAGGPLAFAAAEVVERQGGTRRSHGAVPADALAASGIDHLLSPLTGARPPLAGLDWSRPLLMGILNVTPDSFSDGGRHMAAAAALAHGRAMAEAGAQVIDIGGESTRPGSDPTPPDEECRRILPVIEGLRNLGLPLSVDTRNAATMRAALGAGASLINDVSALTHDARSMAALAASAAPVVLMHAQGPPATMQQAPAYDDVTLDVYDYLAERIAACEAAGIPRSRLIVDPGIGFGKTLDHNVTLLREIAVLHGLGCPLLLGASRKAFIGGLSRGEPADCRMPGSVAAALHGAAQGVQLLRVHDVAETAQALALWRAVWAVE